MKGIWNILNNIIRDGGKQNNLPKYFVINDIENYNMDEVASSFNQFFVDVGPELAKNIPNPGPGGVYMDKLIERNPHSVFLKAVEENEIINIVKKCKNKTSTDCNGIDMSLIKQVIEGVSKPLAHICNLSFQTGTFPNQMKIAKVIPVYKTGSKHNFTNYRPVSILPQLSKIMEKLFNNRMDAFLEKHKLLSESQYGFRVNRSTSQAIMESIEEITDAIDNKKHAIGVFINLKKAFDTMNHNKLFNKLGKYGIRGLVLDWVKSFFERTATFCKVG